MQHSNPPHSQRLKTVFITHITFCFVYKTCVFLHTYIHSAISWSTSATVYKYTRKENRVHQRTSLCCLSIYSWYATIVFKNAAVYLHTVSVLVSAMAEKGRKENMLQLYGHSLSRSLYTLSTIRDTHTHRIYLCKKKSISMLNLGICESVYVENLQRSVESLLFAIYLYFGTYISVQCVCVKNIFECWKIKFIFEVQKFIHVHAWKGTFTQTQIPSTIKETDNFNHFNLWFGVLRIEIEWHKRFFFVSTLRYRENRVVRAYCKKKLNKWIW